MDATSTTKRRNRGPNARDMMRAAKDLGAKAIRFERGGAVIVQFEDIDANAQVREEDIKALL